MNYQLNFTVNLDHRDKNKTLKFVKKYLMRIDKESDNISIEKYWKNENQNQVSFSFEECFASHEEAVYKTLKMAQRLHDHNWTVIGPYDNDFFSFECFLNVSEDLSLQWAHIELCLK